MNEVHNAFTMNVLGLERCPFPYCIETAVTPHKTHTLHICPLAVADIAEVLVSQAQPHFLVFDVDSSHFRPVTSDKSGPVTSLPLVELADEAGVAHQDYGPEVIVIAATALPAFLKDLSHYEIKIIDLTRVPTADEATDLYCHFAESTREPRLQAAPMPLPSRLFVHSHDDCYTSIEAQDRQTVLRVIERSLRLYAETVVATATNAALPNVASVPLSVLEVLLAGPAVTMLRHHTEWDGTLLRIGFAHATFKFQAPVDAPLNGHICYNVMTGVWHTE